jgi:hypothetical protein
MILMAAGACLELLFVVLPLVHLGSWASPEPATLAYVMAALPILAVVGSLVRPVPVLTLCVVPLSHIPLLVVEPRVTSPLVHAGQAGLGTWSLTVISAVAWCVAALVVSRAQPAMTAAETESPGQSFAVWGPTLGALLIWFVFLVPVVGAWEVRDPAGAVTSTLTGLLVAVWVGYRWFGVELADLARDPSARSRLRTQVLLRRRFSSSTFWLAMTVSLVLGIVAAVVYGGH